MKGVHRGDHVYVNTPRGPCSGEVKAVGKHGCTVHIDGATHKVPWERILGHKLRVQHEVRMIDDGEDGAIVELPDGERRFVAGPVEEGTEEERAAGKLVKAIEGGARVIFKAGDVKGRPGLALQQVTDRAGHTTRRWKRTQEDMPKGRPEGGGKAGAEREARGSAAGYGAHNLGPGDAVKFEAGGARASGKIVAAGKDGATVHDGEREHQVLWSEIVGSKGESADEQGDGGKGGEKADGKGADTDAKKTETPEFKQWFGDSKVVDDDGKPLVVYHGTNEDFSKFDIEKTGTSGQGSGEPGFFFDESQSNASAYVSGSRSGGNVIPVYLSIKNPLIVERGNEKHGYDGSFSKVAFANFIDDALENGNDGVIFRDVSDRGKRSTQYVAFRPEQIKSATGNSGAFSADDPDITKALQGGGMSMPREKGGLRKAFDVILRVLGRRRADVAIADAAPKLPTVIFFRRPD